MNHTSRLNIPYPSTTDQANISSDMGNIALAIDNASIYHQTASGATTPSADIGDIWWCSDLTNTNGYYGLNYYDGSSWRNLGPDVVSSSTTPSTPFPGLVWINPNGTIQTYQSGAWTNLIAYKIPAATTDGQFLQYSSSLSALQWATISTVPTGATSGQILYYNGSANAWRNAPSVVSTTLPTSPGVTVGTAASTLLTAGSTLTGFTQYTMSAYFDTLDLGGGTVGSNLTAVASVVLTLVATPASGGGATFSVRVGAGLAQTTANGGCIVQATASIANAIATSTYTFSVTGIRSTATGTLTFKNGQLTVVGIK